jgi:FkbM family methyltransferase
MNKKPARTYHLPIGIKTKILNVPRRLFTKPPLEDWLINALKQQRGIIEKVIPPCYLYAANSTRKVSRWNQINFSLDLSNHNDHEVFYYNPPGHIRYMLNYLKEGSRFLDIGANIGAVSLYCASQKPEVEVLAFEPHPFTYAKASENIRLNPDVKNINLLNIGLSNRAGTAQLVEVADFNLGMNRIMKHPDPDKRFVEIKLAVLDDIIGDFPEKEISVIKIDVEGHESEALEGAEKTIARHRPVIFMELSDKNLKQNGRSARELCEWFYSREYEIRKTRDNTLIGNDLNNTHFDVVCLPKEK